MPDRLSPLMILRSRLASVPPARWRTAFLIFLAAVVAGAAVQYWFKASRPSRIGTLTRTAFLRWQGQVNGLVDGVNVYEGNPYPNPPIQGLVLWPLYQLPGDPHALGGAMLWFALKAGMAGCVLVWAFRLSAPMPGWAKAVAVVLAAHPILGDLSHGNVNIFIAFLVFAALELLRRRRDAAAGVVLGLAVACKVTPALFLPYLVWKRAWTAVVGCLLGLVLWLFVVPGLALGWGHNLTLLESWYGGMVRPFLVEGKVTSQHANQSIPGITFRLLTDEPSAVEYDEDDGRPVPAKFHNVADIGPGSARLVVRACQAAFVVAVVLLCRSRSRQGLWFAAECSLILLGMLLFSERTWKHHAVTLALPYAALAAFLATRPLGPGLRGYIFGTLVLAGVLTIGPGALPEEGQDLALTYGTHTAAFLLLTAAVCVVMAYERGIAALTSAVVPVAPRG
ncbi:MAG TPA: glycosyltransferase family 87 protein [Fimbriiglobus sp.]|nr:glycosyltransferase family 87 protein [Fimbriiglobus sp.]